MPRRIAFLIYPEFQILDITGPITAFEIAARLEPDAYSLQLIALEPGLVASSSGFSMHAAGLPRPDSIDTLVITGGNGSRDAAHCKSVSGDMNTA
jgi:transcriptional regulator GlxA family with amidase domain